MEAVDEKRLFFAAETHCPWPKDFPEGRILAESDRHMTLAFLGKCSWTHLEQLLHQMPRLETKIGIVGYFDDCLLLPKGHPRVAAWQVHWLDHPGWLLSFRERLIPWLADHDFAVSLKGDHFLPHVTICRGPKDPKEWVRRFFPLPMFFKDIHLYESLGNSQYRSLWNIPLYAPFEEMEHTGEVGYLVRAESLEQLYRHAEVALCFQEPDLLQFLKRPDHLENLNDVISELNDLVSEADRLIGCPLKAISYHGEIRENEAELLEWEMVIDV